MSDDPPIDEDVWREHLRQERQREERGEPEESYEPDDEDLARFTEELDNALEQWAMEGRRAREAVLAQLARSFLARDDVSVAVALTTCDLEIVGDPGVALVPPMTVAVNLLCPVESLNLVKFGSGPLHEGLLRSLMEATLPPGLSLGELVIRTKTVAVSDDWREQLQQSVIGAASNQGTPIGGSPIATYNGLNYRSRSEIALAKELETKGILFFPNSRASRDKTTREPDFLIVHNGKVGIIEVDGPTHQGKAANDHMRDLFFEQAGIRVKHFNHEDVRINPGLIVDTFLRLLLGP